MKIKKLNESMRPSQATLDDCLQDYLNNAFGYNGVEDYVDTQYPMHPQEFKAEVVNYIKERKNESLSEDIQHCWFGYYFDIKGNKKYFYMTKDSTSRDPDEASDIMEDSIPEPFTKFVFQGSVADIQAEKQGWRLVESKSIKESIDTNNIEAVANANDSKVIYYNTWNELLKERDALCKSHIRMLKGGSFVSVTYRQMSADICWPFDERTADSLEKLFERYPRYKGLDVCIAKELLHTDAKPNESLSEGIEVATIGDYITDHYEFDDIDDKYSCINSIRDSFKDEKTISKEELEQFIGSHNGKDKVNESKYQDISNVDLDNDLVKDLVARAFDYNQAQWLVDNDIEYAKHLAYDNVSEDEIAKAEQYLSSKGFAHQYESNLKEDYTPDMLDDLVNHYAGRTDFATIWDEITNKFNDEDLANDVIEALELQASDLWEKYLTESKVKHSLAESLFEAVEGYPYMFHYTCNNPTYGYDFQQLANQYGAKKVYGKYKGTGQGRYFYLIPSAGVYNRLKKVAKDKYTVDMQKMLPYDETLYPDVKFMKEGLYEAKRVSDFPEDTEAGDWLKGLLFNADLELENPRILDHYIGKDFADFTLDINGDINRYRIHKGGKVTIKEGLNEASYGGTFDIADDQFFTREDIESAAEEVMNHIDETFAEKYVLGGTWFEKGRWIVNVQSEDGAWEFEELIRVDMRKIKEPWHLKREYAMEMAAKLINSIKYQTQPITEELNESNIIDAEPIETGAEVGMAAIISDLIKDEYEAIDGYNSAIATAQAEGFLDMINVLSEIQAEENLHIGQLQTLMNSVDPNAHLVDDGQQEGIEQLANPIAAEVVEESINANDLTDNVEQAFQDGTLNDFVCDALKDGSATEKDLMLIAIKSSIIEEDDMKKAIANCRED